MTKATIHQQKTSAHDSPAPTITLGPKMGNKQPCHILPLLHFIWHLNFWHKY